MSQIENAKPKGPKHPKLMLVRYGKMGGMGWFEHHESHIPKLNSYVVVKTERGMELGQVVGAHNYRGGQFKSSPEQVEAYYCNRTKDFPLGEGGSFVRFATHEDVREQEHLEKSAIGEAKCAQKLAEKLNLKMRIIEAEHLFGGERIIFYFTSEGRVDFRDLVKQLAREYQTRIELRQIGSRDEARLISDYETCGQQCCCSRYLKILEPVNMRMAKLQKATLDPSKISGHCGRLKCCLRYEDETYMDLKDKLPRRNAMVQTPKGPGKVVDMHILTQLVVVQDQLGDRKAWPVDELKPYDGRNRPEDETPCDRCREMPVAMTPQDAEKTVDAAAITAELEDLAQSEQTQLTPQETPKRDNNNRRPQRPRQGRPGGNGKGATPNQRPDAQPKSGDGTNPPAGKNRRRRSKNRNRNRNKNNPQGGGTPPTASPSGE
jgi:cell fate regulator YaaT (PSP1 superfamily)